MKKWKKALIQLMVALFVVFAVSDSTNAAWHNYSRTVETGASFTDDDFCMYGSGQQAVFTNNGTVTITTGFNLMYKASFVNNGTLTFTGNSSTFDVSSGCSFYNYGTASISGCYNLGMGNTFVNEGELYLSNIQSLNVDGLENRGKIICDDTISESMISSLQSKSTGTGQVITQGTSTNPSVSTKYGISYNLNGGSWNGTIKNDWMYYDSNSTTQSWKIGIDEPYKDINNTVKRDGYVLTGWTCDKNADAEPATNLDILSSWQGDITLTAHWKPAQQTIYFYLNGGVIEAGTTTLDIVRDGNYSYSLFHVESDDFKLPTPKKSGYDFGGWILSGQTTPQMEVTIPKGTIGDLAYTAKWIPRGDTPYTVSVYYMDENGKYLNTANITRNEVTQTNSNVEIPPTTFDKDGFTFDSAKSVTSGVADANHTLELSMYYKRNQYEITFKTNDGSEELYKYTGYYGTNIEYKGTTSKVDEAYTYQFLGWSKTPDSQYALSDIGTIKENKTFYAVFRKDAKNCQIIFDDLSGFKPLSVNSVSVKKGEAYHLTLYLANENYYIGTSETALAYKELSVYASDGQGLFCGKDYTIHLNGYGNAVTVTIPNVTKDLHIIFKANYHENHDYSYRDDVVKKEATCTKKGEVIHVCYLCGKTETETTACVATNHEQLLHINAKAATNREDGNIEYWYCEACKKYFSDKEGTKEITKDATIILKKEADNNTITTNIPGTGDFWIEANLFCLFGSAVVFFIVNKKRKDMKS